MLSGVRLQGAIFLRAEYTEGWCYTSPAASELRTFLAPAARHLVLFHIVARGTCWVALPGGERHWATQGDVVVLPYGDHHAMGGQDEAEPVPLADLLGTTRSAAVPLIRHGDGGSRTDVVCGYLDADDVLFDPRMRALPPVLVVRPTGAAAAWVAASVGFALERSARGDAGPVRTRLPELLLLETLRLHLGSTPATGLGWFAALRDPVLAPALAAVHHDPAGGHTVARLARVSGVSRSLLDRRFREVLGLAPIRYVAEWRLHVAKGLLATTTLGVAAVARRVGFESEEAFSRAFKRGTGQPPSHWRTTHLPL